MSPPNRPVRRPEQTGFCRPRWDRSFPPMARLVILMACSCASPLLPGRLEPAESVPVIAPPPFGELLGADPVAGADVYRILTGPDGLDDVGLIAGVEPLAALRQMNEPVRYHSGFTALMR